MADVIDSATVISVVSKRVDGSLSWRMRAPRGPPDRRDSLKKRFWHLVKTRGGLSKEDRRQADIEIDQITRKIARLDKAR